LPQPSTGTSALGRGRPGDRRYAFGGGWPGGPLFGRTAGIGGGYKVIGVRSGYEAGGWDPARRSLPPASPTSTIITTLVLSISSSRLPRRADPILGRQPARPLRPWR